MKLDGRLVARDELTPQLRDAMFALLERHYDNVTRDTFETDLAEKEWVILLFDPTSQALCGFSTQMRLKADVGGRVVTALFSGDTIIAREHWGDTALQHVGGKLAMSLADAQPGGDLYWFLISKGYKTYRFLPVFFHDFHPHPERPTRADVRAALDALAGRKFPGRYDADRGIVAAGPTGERLRPGVADVTPERMRDPFVRFFTERNPGHAAGDELCCLAPLTRDNFTPAAHRVLRAQQSTRGEF